MTDAGADGCWRRTSSYSRPRASRGEERVQGLPHAAPPMLAREMCRHRGGNEPVGRPPPTRGWTAPALVTLYCRWRVHGTRSVGAASCLAVDPKDMSRMTISTGPPGEGRGGSPGPTPDATPVRLRPVAVLIVLILVQLVVAQSLNLFRHVIAIDFYQYWAVGAAPRLSAQPLGSPYTDHRTYTAVVRDYAARSGQTRLTLEGRVLGPTASPQRPCSTCCSRRCQPTTHWPSPCITCSRSFCSWPPSSCWGRLSL